MSRKKHEVKLTENDKGTDGALKQWVCQDNKGLLQEQMKLLLSYVSVKCTS